MAKIEHLATALLVSDDPTTREVIASTLEEAGYSVVQVEREEARACVLARPVDVILLDLSEPDVAEETARQLKEACVAPFVPLLRLTTIEHEAPPLAESLGMGAYALLDKPVAPQVLLPTMSTLVRLGQAYRETHQERTKLEELLQQMPSGVIIADAEGQLQATNGRAREILCLPEVPGSQEERIRTLQPAQQGVLAGIERWPLRRALRTGERVIGEEFVVTCGDGSQIVARVSAAPIRSPEGEIVAGVLTFTDITAHKQMEEALRQLTEELEQRVVVRTAELRESEERFRALVTASSDVVYRMSPDWSEMRFLQGREFLADTLDPSRTWLEKYIHPDDQPHVLAVIHEAIRTKSVFALEHRVRRADGTLGWTFSRAIPLLDDEGEIVEWFGAAADVTARREAEEALRGSEERLRLAQDIAQVGTFDWDIRTGLNVWTPELEAMYGLPAGGFARTQPAWEALVHPEDRASAVATVNRAFETDAPVEGEWRVVWPDGSVHWLTGRFQVLRDESGAPARLTGMNIDITARKRAEEALRQLMEELEQRVTQRTAELRESEERSRAIVDNSQDAILVTDPAGEGQVVAANAAASRMLGWTEEELIGLSRRDILDVNDPRLAQALTAREREGVMEAELTYKRKDGSTLTGEIASRLFLDREGNRRMVAVIRDVSARKQAEAEREALLEQVQDQRALLETVLENTRSNIAYYSPDLVLRMANQAYVQNARMPREALVGRSMHELFADPKAEAIFRQVLETKEPVEITEMPYTFTRHPEWGTHYYDWRLVPVLDARGEVDGLVSSTVDVTDRVRERQRIEEREHRHAELARFLAAFLDNAPIPMAYLDPELRFVRVNQQYAKWAGQSADALIGRTHWEVWHLPERVEALREALQAGVPVQREEMPFTYPTQPGPQGYVDYRVFPVKDDAGAVVGLVLVVQDVSERVERREQLLAAERSRAELAEGLNREIAHRTKNNLAMVAGLLQLQIAQQRHPEVGAALSDSVSRLMTFASIQQEMQAAATTGWVDLLPVLRRVGAASSGPSAGGEAMASVSGASVVLPSRTATNLAVIANELITNAIKYGAAGPDGKLRVDVEIRPEGDSLRLCVWNSGNPVSEGFDAVSRPGMGLGLVGDLAASYGGTLSLTPARGGTLAEVVVPLEALQREG